MFRLSASPTIDDNSVSLEGFRILLILADVYPLSWFSMANLLIVPYWSIMACLIVNLNSANMFYSVCDFKFMIYVDKKNTLKIFFLLSAIYILAI